jgi:citrate lyase subunit beta/citryl-CoA lyase
MQASSALFEDQFEPVYLPACDHYAGSEKLMLKSMALQNQLVGAFDITFDCEDGAAIGNEKVHAELIASLINSDTNRFKRIGVRVHEPNHTHFAQDIAILLAPSNTQPAYLVLPKIESSAQLVQAITEINAITDATNQARIAIHALIETHGALAEVHQIAAHPQVACLSFGIMDFVSAHLGAIPVEAMHSPGQFTHPLVLRAKLEIAAACHRFGKVASHNVTTALDSPESAFTDAKHAFTECGFTRMWSIHPMQIPAIINAMTPKPHEIEEAVELLGMAQEQQWAPVKFKNRLHDRASYRYYWSLIKKAKINQIALPKKAYNFA